MERKNKTILQLLFFVLLLAGCKSSKDVTSATGKVNLQQIKNLPAVSGGMEGVAAKMKLSAVIDGKTLSSAGNLKVKKGCGVQLSITPLGLFEAARVEFLPLYVQYINKLEGEYARINYSDVSILQELGITYALLESVFLNGIYIPSAMNIDEVLKDVSVVSTGGTTVITDKMNDITYEYYIDDATGLLVKSVGTYRNGTSVSCAYGDFKQVGERYFPASIELSLGGANKVMKLSFMLSKIKDNEELNPTLPSSSYKKVAPSAFLKILGINK